MKDFSWKFYSESFLSSLTSAQLHRGKICLLKQHYTPNSSDAPVKVIELKWRLKLWRQTQRNLMGVALATIPSLKPCEPEDEELFLPSAFDASTQVALKLTGLAAKEAKLCEGVLYDEILKVQVMSKKLSNMYDFKQQNV